MRPSQTTLFKQHSAFALYSRTEHGGDLRKGRRKLWRPYDPRRPIHLVLKSSRAVGAWSFLDDRNRRRVRHLIERFAAKNGVRVFRFANAGNHLHLVVQAKQPEQFKSFLRTISGLIARAVTGARKSHAMGKFWDRLAWTRIVSWGNDLKRLLDYVLMNEMEGEGVWRREWSARRRP
jgi:hypothetical protein